MDAIRCWCHIVGKFPLDVQKKFYQSWIENYASRNPATAAAVLATLSNWLLNEVTDQLVAGAEVPWMRSRVNEGDVDKFGTAAQAIPTLSEPAGRQAMLASVFKV